MRTDNNEIDHEAFKRLKKELVITQYVKTTPYRYYLNLKHDTTYKLQQLFRLTLVRNEDGSVRNAIYRGEAITVEEWKYLMSSGRLPRKIWVSGGKVHTDAGLLNLTTKDTEAIVNLFKTWAVNVGADLDVDIEFATAVSEEVQLLEANSL